MEKLIKEGKLARKRIVMDDKTKAQLSSRDTVPTSIKVREREYYPKQYIASGFKGVVWRGLDEYNESVAIKFTIYDDYRERSYLEEAGRARKLNNYGAFANFIDAGIVENSFLEQQDGKIHLFHSRMD